MKPKPNKHVTTIKCNNCGELLVKVFPWCPPMEFKMEGVNGKQLCKKCVAKLPREGAPFKDYPEMRSFLRGLKPPSKWRLTS